MRISDFHFIVLTTIETIFSHSTYNEDPDLDAWVQPIQNIKDPYINALGEFSVYNGGCYMLILAAKDGAVIELYQASVGKAVGAFEEPYLVYSYRELTLN